MDETKMFGVSHRSLVLILIYLHVLIFALMVGCVLTSHWVEMKDDSDDDWPFVGSIAGVEEGLGEYEGATYDYLSTRYCSLSDAYEGDVDEYDALCIIFTGLALACCPFCLIECSAIVCVVTTLFWLCSNFASLSCLWIPFVTATLGFIGHLAGLVYYTYTNKVVFDGDCETLHHDGTPGNLCASDGAILSLAVLILYFIVVVALCTTLCKLFKNQCETGQLPSVELSHKGYKEPSVKTGPDHPNQA